MDIKKSPSGKVLRSAKGDYNVYVPHALPPELAWNNQLATALSQADFVVGQLAREGGRLPNPHLLIRPFVAREAVLSSKIEGTQATVGEVLAHDAGVSVQEDAGDLQEIQNYIQALDFGVQKIPELPLSLRLIKELHRLLMNGVRGAHATPGEFRKVQNWIGIPGSTIATAKFVPPSVDFLPTCLDEFEEFLHDRQLPPLVHIALCHYQFEAIHPFLDGNGRVGRLLISLLLVEKNILPAPLLYLSAFFEATRDTYYRSLFNVSSTGAWQDWLIYFLNGVATQSADALSRAERINNLIYEWKLLVASSSSRVPVDIVERFAVNPYLTANKVAQELSIAYSTAQRGINKLEQEGIIQQIGDKKRDKVYCATKILAILEEPAQINIDPAYTR